jgi:hypothetical protein
MGTFYEPLERNRWSEDADGVPFITKTEDEILTVPIDWTDRLGSATISTSTWTASGVTTSGAALASPVATIKVTGTDGEVTNKITTSDGQTFERKRRFKSPNGVRSDDYGNL